MSETQKHTKPNVPDLRFPGFEGAWEKYRLKDIVDRVTRKNKALETNRPLTISAQYGLIDQTDFFKKTVASQDLSNYYLLFNGEFAYNKSYSAEYPWGAIKRLDLYDKGVLSSLYICFKPKETVESDYLVHYFESTKWHQGVADIAGEGARNHGLLNIAIPDYFNTIHYLPSVDEQRKIAGLLNLIDERIAIQNKVIEDLKKLKAALCDKLIWHNRELTDLIPLRELGVLKNGYAFKSSTYQPNTKFSIITIANVTGERYIDVFACKTIPVLPTDLQCHQILKQGDILISLTGNVGRVSLCREGSYLLNQRVGLFTLSDESLREYVFQALSCPVFQKEMESSGQGAAQMNIGKSDIEQFTIPFTSNKDSLMHIANVLYLFDQRIATSKKGMELFEMQRAYLLNVLFK